MYKLLSGTSITRLSDGASIPPDPANTDYAQYLTWLTAGNTPLPADVPTLADLKLVKWEKIKLHRDHLRFEGGVKVGTNWFLSTELATVEYNTLRINAIDGGIQDTVVMRAGWRTMNGTLVDMTPLLVKQILAAGLAKVAAIDDVAQSHKASMELSLTPDTYNFSAGWPVVYIP